MRSMIDEIRDCVANIETQEVRRLVRNALKAGIPAYEIFTGGLAKGIDVVGQKYEAGEYFLTELPGAGHVVKDGMDELGSLS